MPKKAPAKVTKPRRAKHSPASWTIAVFMIGDEELQSSFERDLFELERAGPSDTVEIVVAVQRRAGAPVEWLEIAGSEAANRPRRRVRTAQQPAGMAQTLRDRFDEFLAFVAAHHRAEHYVLILWGHASGFEFGRFQPGSEDDRLRLGQVAASLEKFRSERGGTKLEILGFCACAVSKADFAVELQDAVDFLVSSQVGISTLMTWPFDEIAQAVVQSPSIQPETLASRIVQCFEEFYEPPPVALTALDLKASHRLRDQVDGLAESILAAVDVPGDRGLLNNLCVLAAFQKALDAYPYELEPLVDFYDFCRRLMEEDALEESVRARARAILDGGVRAFVVYNARSGPKLGALHGLSILAPDQNHADLATIIDNCSRSPGWFWRHTRWVEMVRAIHEFALSRRDLT
jgi:hypothetical protein